MAGPPEDPEAFRTERRVKEWEPGVSRLLAEVPGPWGGGQWEDRVAAQPSDLVGLLDCKETQTQGPVPNDTSQPGHLSGGEPP